MIVCVLYYSRVTWPHLRFCARLSITALLQAWMSVFVNHLSQLVDLTDQSEYGIMKLGMLKKSFKNYFTVVQGVSPLRSF